MDSPKATVKNAATPPKPSSSLSKNPGITSGSISPGPSVNVLKSGSASLNPAKTKAKPSMKLNTSAQTTGSRGRGLASAQTTGSRGRGLASALPLVPIGRGCKCSNHWIPWAGACKCSNPWFPWVGACKFPNHGWKPGHQLIYKRPVSTDPLAPVTRATLFNTVTKEPLKDKNAHVLPPILGGSEKCLHMPSERILILRQTLQKHLEFVCTVLYLVYRAYRAFHRRRATSNRRAAGFNRRAFHQQQRAAFNRGAAPSNFRRATFNRRA